MVTTPAANGLRERLEQDFVLCAQGYLFELERRGYLQAGPFVPEAILDHPDVVRQLHRDFVHAGSDVVQALTYYAHREKLRLVGREGQLEAMNRAALDIAKQVAAESGTLFAGNISNTNVYEPDDAATHRTVRAMFEEQVAWAADAGVDYVIGETFSWLGEAQLALEVIQAAGLPAVITLAITRNGLSWEEKTPADCCRILEQAGADVVGLNCMRGPATMLPLLASIREAVDCPVAALPVPYRTDAAHPTFQSLEDPGCDCIPENRPFPVALDALTCNRYEMARFARAAHDLGATYLGGCCGTGPHHVRAMAEALGRHPPASRYSPDMSRHAYFGTHEAIPAAYRRRAERW